MVNVSIYHCCKSFGLLKEVQKKRLEVVKVNKDKEDEKAEKNKEYTLQILYTIYKYRAINKNNISYCLNFKYKSEWKNKNLRKSLRKLREDDYIRAYGTKENQNDEYYKVVIYVLTEKGAEWLKENGRKINRNQLYQEDVEQEELMEQASMSQYHVSMIKNHGYFLLESEFNNYKSLSGVPCQSKITIKNPRTPLYSQEIGKRRITLFAFPVPKKDDQVEHFLEKLLIFINDEMVKNPHEQTNFILFVCESSSMANKMAWNLNKYRQTRPFPVLYIHDMATAGSSPLSNILSCVVGQEGIVNKNINLFEMEW